MVKPRSIHKSSKLLMAIWGVQTAFWDLASCIRPHELYDTIWYYMGMNQYLSIPFLGEWTSINPSYFDVNYRGTRFWHTVIWYYMQQNPTYLPTPKTTSTQRFFLMAFVTHPNSASWWTRRCARCCPLTQMPQICPWPGILVEPKSWALVAGNQRLRKNCMEKMRDFLFEQQKWGLKQEKWNVGHQKQDIYSKNGGLKQNSSSTAENWPSLREHSNEARGTGHFWLVRSRKFNPQFVCRSYPSSVGMMLHHHTPDSVGSH